MEDLKNCLSKIFEISDKKFSRQEDTEEKRYYNYYKFKLGHELDKVESELENGRDCIEWEE